VTGTEKKKLSQTALAAAQTDVDQHTYISTEKYTSTRKNKAGWLNGRGRNNSCSFVRNN